MSMAMSISVGGAGDYAALAHWHYVTGHPRGVTMVLVARCALVDEPAGVLVVTRPPLNGRWRGIVWPGWLDGFGKRERAARINRELRCIARIIVDPRVRGIGVASALVRAYLRKPQTHRTECVARYGALVPLLERAGMRRADVPPTRDEARLRSAVASRGILPWMLADASTRARLTRDAELVSLWRVWAMSSRATRRFAGRADAVELTWARLATTGAVFTYVAGCGSGEGCGGGSLDGLGVRAQRGSPIHSDVADFAATRPFAAEPARARRQEGIARLGE